MGFKNKYPYKEYHQEINGALYKKCAFHEEFFPVENPWFSCTTEYFYKNDKNKKDGLTPECKKCTQAKLYKWRNEHRDQLNATARNERKNNDKVKQIGKRHSEKQRKSGWRTNWEHSESGKASLKKSQEKRKVKNHIITDNEWIACKNYFMDEDGDWACIYCGLKAKDHYKEIKGIDKLFDLEKEHVDDKGTADLDNCVPSCCHCNGSKHTTTLDAWYNSCNPKFEQWRYDKIIKWITEDYKIHIEEKKPKRKYNRKKY
jgi:hypothetical protein